MLRITAVSAGAVDYLLKGSGCSEHEHASQRVDLDAVGAAPKASRPDAAQYLMTSAHHGEPAGVWFGKGLIMVGIEAGREATEHDVRAVFGRLQHPSSTKENPQFLGRAPRKFKSTEERVQAALEAEPDATEERIREISAEVRGSGRKAVAYYDLTFSPPKSVSVYYAALVAEGRMAEAAQVVEAHRAAVAEAMAYVEEQAAYTRTGYHGKTANGRSVGVYEKATGLVWTRWDHSTSRAQEPQLHSHVAVLNRVVSAETGKVQALDGKGFRPIKAGVDAQYREALERELGSRRGVVFASRPDGKAREILGVDQELLAAGSTRRSQVVERTKELVADYAARHGRAPSPAARKALAQQATLETRAPKSQLHPGEQYRRWADGKGPALRTTLADIAMAPERVAREGHPDQREGAQRSRDEVLRAAVGRVQAQYATWDVGNLQDAIKKERESTPAVTGTLPELADEVLRNGAAYGVLMVSAPDPGEVPAALQGEDGKSRYRGRNDERYATVDHLATEVGIVARARELTAPALVGPELELARVELIAAGLGPDQADAAVGILSSGRAADVLIGPAGAGKSRTVGALTRTWEDRFGGRVLGLATSQIAATVLAEHGLEAMNTTVFLHRFTPDGNGAVAEQVRPGDLFIVDEAGMSSTVELEQISRIVAAGGGKVLYTGDHEQLVAVGAGGILDLLVRDNGAFELTEIHRFAHEWERDASIRLRAGDETVLDLYEDHGRLHGGTAEEMTAAAVRAWLASTLEGKEALLVVRDNAQATELSEQIRTELVRLGRVDSEVLATARDGNFIGAGDVIQARRNDASLRVDGRGMVTNRETYRVLDLDPLTGALRVEAKNGVVAHLPAQYVREHVTLAYASTTHAAQGRTVDVGLSLTKPGMTRADVYVPGSRGRESNHFFVICEQAPDHHDVEPLDSSPRAVLAEILAKTDSDSIAAELARRAGEEEGRSLSFVGTQWDLLTTEYGRDRYTDTLASLLPASTMDVLVAEPGYDRLMRTVREAELGGHDPAAVLAEAVGARSLNGADSMSDVIRWRIRTLGDDRIPEREIPSGDWAALTTPMDGPVGEYASVLAEAATARQAELGERAAAERPAWAVTHLGEPPAEELERAEWVRRAGVAAAYRELRNVPETSVSLGAAPSREQEFHRALWQQAYAALGAPTDALDYTAASDTELREMRQAWRREQTWAPYYVAEEIADARLVAEGYRHDAVLWRAEAALLPQGSAEREQAERDIAGVEQLATEYSARVEQLEAVHAARGEWAERAEAARLRDQLAGDELQRRGLPRDIQPVAGEQAELFKIVDADEATVDTAQERKDRDQLSLDLDLDDGHDEPVQVIRTPAESAAVEPEAEVAGTEIVDENQTALFAVEPSPADVAAAQPLRTDEKPGGTAQVVPGDQQPVTVGEARRQAEVLAALRAEIADRTENEEAVRGWRHGRDVTDQQVETERVRRDQAERHGHRVERQQGVDLDRGPELSRGLGR